MANLQRSGRVPSAASSTQTNTAEAPAFGYAVALAQHQDEIRESQRLRYQVFAQEMGASLKSAADELDYDSFDEYCKHLIVRDKETGEVIASTRVLLDADARRAGSFYSEAEFDMQPLIARCGPLMEIGRTCVHPNYRRGAAIAVLWSGLGKFFDLREYSRMIGCASIPMQDGGGEASAAYQWLVQHKLVINSFGVMPRLPLPVLPSMPPAAMLPPLIKAYVRLGARICGTPCWDPDFNSADLLVVLDPQEIRSRYARHFLQRAC
ncbi:MAG: GNAT family N-acyltransferase [Gammaproteobacteria bacterium]